MTAGLAELAALERPRPMHWCYSTLKFAVPANFRMGQPGELAGRRGLWGPKITENKKCQ